jgi:hypothetical protein
MAPLLEVARTGLAAVLLHPLRSLVSFGAVVAVLLPYLAGTALSKGLEAEAEAAFVSASRSLFRSVLPFSLSPAGRYFTQARFEGFSRNPAVAGRPGCQRASFT